MAKRKRNQTINVRNYGDDWVNRLAVVCDQFEKMGIDEATAALRFIVSKYNLQEAFMVIAQEQKQQ